MNLEKLFTGENDPQKVSVEHSRIYHPKLWEVIDFVCNDSKCDAENLDALAMEIYQSLAFDTDTVFKEWEEEGLFEEKTKYLQEVIQSFLHNPTKENLRLIVKAFE